MTDPLLQLNGLACERDDRCLFAGLDLVLQAREAVQLRGPNGAGKTTLLRCIAGLHLDYQGNIGLPEGWPEGQQFLFVGHRPGISPLLTAAENLTWHLRLAGLVADDDSVAQALARVGLEGWEQVAGAQMSAGQQRRTALARLALPTARVPLWLLDEPFTALDDDGVELVKGLMREQLLRGGAVLFTTHQPVTELPGMRTHWIGAAPS